MQKRPRKYDDELGGKRVMETMHFTSHSVIPCYKVFLNFFKRTGGDLNLAFAMKI